MSRIAYLDMVKLVTIYLVILGHVTRWMVDGWVIGGRLIHFIYSFHMPLFMLISGYFISGKSLKMPLFELIRVKGIQLLFPSFTCTALCCLYFLLFRYEHFHFRDEIIGNSWFLKTLFVIYVLFWICKRTGVNDWLIMIISTLLLFIIPHASSLQVNLLWPYFWVGYLLHNHEVLNRIAGTWTTTTLIVIVFAGCYSFQRHLNIPNYIPINALTLLSHEWWRILLRYAVAFSGSMSVILTISLVNRYLGERILFEDMAKYGKYTLGVYVLQNIVVENVFPDTLAWYVESEWLLDAVIAPTLSVGFLVLCLWMIHILSKNKTLDLLFFGGQYYKQ